MNNTDKQLFLAYETPTLKELDFLVFPCAAGNNSNPGHEDTRPGDPSEEED